MKFFLIICTVIILTLSCSKQENNTDFKNETEQDSSSTLNLTDNQKKVLAGAKMCLEAEFRYDNEMAYHVLKYGNGEYTGSAVYPNGDLDPSIGVCTEVTIRALRLGGLCDLQKEIHEDIIANWNDYPMSRWSAKKPDANIDHRRVPNQLVWFGKNWEEITDGKYKPGDVIVWDMNGDGWSDHIGIMSDNPASAFPKGEVVRYSVIHNFPSPGYVAEEDVLNRWEIAGVYRIK